MRKKIAVVTGSRAEYGLLYWLLKAIQKEADLELQLIVTAMHLSDEFGLTYQVIEQDGFEIAAKVHMLLSSDDSVAVAKSIGVGVMGFADVYHTLKPDMVVILGDRFEILAATQAAFVMKIPVAHIHGGELTAGAIDDGIRHAITKMSHLHFVAAETYRKRVIQMGENPSCVFNVGAPGLDHLYKSSFFTKKELETKLNMSFKEKNFLITYHPETAEKNNTFSGVYSLLEALDHYSDANLIFTCSNADEGGRKINRLIKDYLAERSNRGYVFVSLGSPFYLSLLKHVDLVIGNSSSGLIEAPTFHVATVNVGQRQAGRLLASSVISCDEVKTEIIAAIDKALSEDFQNHLSLVESLYGFGGAAEKMVAILKDISLEEIAKKNFYDWSIPVHEA